MVRNDKETSKERPGAPAGKSTTAGPGAPRADKPVPEADESRPGVGETEAKTVGAAEGGGGAAAGAGGNGNGDGPPPPPGNGENGGNGGNGGNGKAQQGNHDEGLFEIKYVKQDDPSAANYGEFFIHVKDTPQPIPDDQREIELSIYETIGIMKLLREQRVFGPMDKSYREFMERLSGVARVGLAAKHVKTRLAAKALEQIRAEIGLRKGAAIKLSYLFRLACWGVGGIAAGGLVVLAASVWPEVFSPVYSYGWLIMGAMVGAWMSIAATRQTVEFDELPNLLGSHFEQFARMLFVALLASAVGLMLELDILTLEVAGINLNEFARDPRVALFLGLVAGIGEKALSARLIDRANEIVARKRS